MNILVSSNDRPEHSRLGASGAERWINCPGSAAPLPEHLQGLPETDEPEYRQAGTCAHEAIHHAMVNGLDGWELIGETFNGYEVDGEMAENIQVYLDECRRYTTGQWGCEQAIDAPEFHPEFYGTTDFWALTGEGKCLVIRDYKNGAGLVVEVEQNPQIMYYAYGILRRFPDVELVDLGIVQPNVSWHPEGVVRRWVIQASDIFEWAEAALRPAMIRADGNDVTLVPGEWCRFCPRKLVCPALKGMFAAAAHAKPDDLSLFDDAQLGQEYINITAVNSYIKAVKEETLRRLLSGKAVEGTKLVQQKANRVWKEDAEAVLKPLFGDAIYSRPELLSPPAIEKLGDKAKALVKEYAYSPGGAPTVALVTDKRPEITVTDNLRAAAQKMIDSGAI